jgi:hypothetical protein
MSPRTGLDVLDKRKISFPLPTFEPRILQPPAWSLYLLSYPCSSVRNGRQGNLAYLKEFKMLPMFYLTYLSCDCFSKRLYNLCLL